jgi:hypothetical protein
VPDMCLHRFAFFFLIKARALIYHLRRKCRLEQLQEFVSVRKVVPTLTNKSVEIYRLMAGAKQYDDTSLSWIRPWAVRPAGVRLAAVLRCTVVLAEESYK